MEDRKKDLIRLMETQIQYHEREIERIKRALAAYMGDANDSSTSTQRTIRRRKKVKWKEHVTDFFKHTLSADLDAIQKALVNNGVDQARSTRGRSAINTTLSRMVISGELLKNDDGQFTVKQPNPTDNHADRVFD